MNIATTLRAITKATAAMPAIPLDHPIHGAIAMIQKYAAKVEALKKAARGGPPAPFGSPASLRYSAAGLAGEVGELLAELLAEEPDRAKIIKEVGDVLWYVDTALAIHGATLDDAVAALLAKMQGRHADRMAAAGYRPAPATIEELRREPGWHGWVNGAAHDLGGPLWLYVEGARVAIVAKQGAKDSGGRTLTSAIHPTEAAAVRAAIDIVAALTPR